MSYLNSVRILFLFSFIFISCSKDKSVKKSVPKVIIEAQASIHPTEVKQTIEGFGGASIPIWIGDLTADQRTKAFSPQDGIGMSILRVMIPQDNSQFASEKPTIDAAKSYGAKVIATAWNAPSSMMDGAKLKETAYSDYAAHLKDYNDAVGGVYAIIPWNEPNFSGSDWMKASATEVANFVAQYGNACGAPLAGPEPFNMDQDFISSYLNNADAKANTKFISGHIYGKQPYDLGDLGKSVWMTEHYTNSKISANDWSNAMVEAKEINDCMNVGWSAYVWWYIRRFYGPIDENSNITKVGYVMAQFSKFIRPGFQRIDCTSNPVSGVFMTAYKNEANKLVVVIINQNSDSVHQTISFSNISINSLNSYETTESSNLTPGTINVSNNSFEVTQSPSSIITLVSQ